MAPAPDDHPPLRLGISACLLGQEVRFDGQHKRDGFLVETVGRFVEWVPVCPEDESGMGTPREPMHLEGDSADPVLVTIRTRRDLTSVLGEWADEAVPRLMAEDLDGFVLKKGSPSCGLERVKVRPTADATPIADGRGIFAAALARANPNLPMEEEGRLNDPLLRESFFGRVFTYRRWRTEVLADPRPKHLVGFHSRHKYAVLAHEPEAYRDLGRMVATAGSADLDELLPAYERRLMAAMSKPAVRRRHVNVLQHLMGFLPDGIADSDRQGIHEVIGEYQQGLVPLVVPVTLLRFFLRGDDVNPWVRDQVYLQPYPRELMLRNSV